MKKIHNRKAFTLAEVLITLGIIGVVAALTIPTLMANYQKTQYVAGLKKAYAEITEAMKLMANDYGCPDDLKCTGVFIEDDNVTLGNAFKKYFKLAKDCGTTYTASDEKTKCMSDAVSDNYDGSKARYDLNDDYNGNYTFITADGFSISLMSRGCSVWVNIPELNLYQVCGELMVDVNGFKGPNNYGRDIFHFYMTNGRGAALYPDGGKEGIYGGWSWTDASGNPKYCTEDNSNRTDGAYGLDCAGRIMEQGWQMNY